MCCHQRFFQDVKSNIVFSAAVQADCEDVGSQRLKQTSVVPPGGSSSTCPICNIFRGSVYDIALHVVPVSSWVVMTGLYSVWNVRGTMKGFAPAATVNSTKFILYFCAARWSNNNLIDVFSAFIDESIRINSFHKWNWSLNKSSNIKPQQQNSLKYSAIERLINNCLAIKKEHFTVWMNNFCQIQPEILFFLTRSLESFRNKHLASHQHEWNRISWLEVKNNSLWAVHHRNFDKQFYG